MYKKAQTRRGVHRTPASKDRNFVSYTIFINVAKLLLFRSGEPCSLIVLSVHSKRIKIILLSSHQNIYVKTKPFIKRADNIRPYNFVAFTKFDLT